MDDDILDQFEEECGVRVNQDIFSSNEDMIARIQAGNSGYDLIVPSDYAVQIMVERGLLHEINRDNIPNYGNLNPTCWASITTRTTRYSMPYQWGTTGIAYNRLFETHIDSWAYHLEPEHGLPASRLHLPAGRRAGSGGRGLKYLGYSYNDTDPDHHAEARDLLIASKRMSGRL
jgi:spermidine/putrescine transport system substrate-binding protein